MKKYLMLIAAGVASLMLLSACGSAASSASQSVPVEVDNMVYRGTVEEVLEDGSIRVAQQEGFNYGQESIVFHLDDKTVKDEETAPIAKDAFVEVEYSGVLTRSLPPQGTATAVTVISPRSEGIITNGTIKTVTKDENGGWRIAVLPLDATEDTNEQQVILIVPADALENLTEAELVEGAVVSAVTRGIAAMSLPPQVPVVVLLPYQA